LILIVLEANFFELCNIKEVNSYVLGEL
jgi:hypothetical protein